MILTVVKTQKCKKGGFSLFVPKWLHLFSTKEVSTSEYFHLVIFIFLNFVFNSQTFNLKWAL